MKKLKISASIFMALSVFFSIPVYAQNSNTTILPQTISATFHAKYANAVVKSCKSESDKYVVKAEIEGKKCFVRFDKNGNWINTMSNIRWNHNLPVAVNDAFNKTKYRAWYVDFITKIEEPGGEFYRIIVDNKYLQDPDHAAAFTEDKALKFKTDGALVNITDVSDGPLAYSVINR